MADAYGNTPQAATCAAEHLHVMHFFRHAVSLPHTAALPVTHRCLRAYLQLFLNMCSPDISLHIHHDKHT